MFDYYSSLIGIIHVSPLKILAYTISSHLGTFTKILLIDVYEMLLLHGFFFLTINITLLLSNMDQVPRRQVSSIGSSSSQLRHIIFPTNKAMQNAHSLRINCLQGPLLLTNYYSYNYFSLISSFLTIIHYNISIYNIYMIVTNYGLYPFPTHLYLPQALFSLLSPLTTKGVQQQDECSPSLSLDFSN